MARQTDNYYLVIQESTIVDDSGQYTTEASSAYGASKTIGNLTVTAAESSSHTTNSGNTHESSSSIVKSSGKAPEFKKLFYDAFVLLGEVTRLETTIIGSPKPRVILVNYNH
jgi:hypothetical protein